MRRTNERGSIVATTAILLAILIFIIGFAVDFGVLYAARNATQNAADAAAMAGVYAYINGRDPTIAANQASQVNPIIGKVVTPSSVTAFRCNDSLGQQNYCVTAVVNATGPVFFTKVFGKQPVPIQTTATAQANTGLGFSVDCAKPLFLPDTVVATATPGMVIPNIMPTDPKTGTPLVSSTYYALDFASLLAPPLSNQNAAVNYSDGTSNISNGGNPNGGTPTYSDSWSKCVVTALHCGQQVRVQTGAKGNATAFPVQDLINAGQTTISAPIWTSSQQIVNGNGNFATVIGFAQLSGLACANGGKKGTCNNSSNIQATYQQKFMCTTPGVGSNPGSYATPVRLVQ